MQYILNQKQMQQCDINTMEHFGVISPVLMERAALCVTEEIISLRAGEKKPVLIVCGTGNNGGDGLAAARMLLQKDIPVEIWFPGNEEKTSPECRRQLEIVRKYRIPVLREAPEKEYAVVADCVFGIGLSREVGGIWKDVILAMNDLPGKKLAVDICSGIHTDTGQVMGCAFRADATVTFGFQKLGHVLFPGAEYSGTVFCRDMGIDRFSLLDMKIPVFHLEDDALRRLTLRPARSNKGDYGKLLLVAGSKNMAGAAVLAAQGAYAAGAGLVRVFTPECNRGILQTAVPEAVLTTYEEDRMPEELLREAIDWADAVVAGPGLGQGKTAEAIVEYLRNVCQKPLLLDADALNLTAAMHREAQAPGAVITPHPGEMQRLSGIPVKDQQKDLINVALDFAKEYNKIVVLKDAHTVIASPDGTVCINLTGNPGMATGGSGDVLSGIIGCLLALGMDAFDAAACGCFLHGKAGDFSAAAGGMAGMTAKDLPAAVRKVLHCAEESRAEMTR